MKADRFEPIVKTFEGVYRGERWSIESAIVPAIEIEERTIEPGEVIPMPEPPPGVARVHDGTRRSRRDTGKI